MHLLLQEEKLEGMRNDFSFYHNYINEFANHTTTTWSLFPRFCLLNPMPGLRMADKVQ